MFVFCLITIHCLAQCIYIPSPNNKYFLTNEKGRKIESKPSEKLLSSQKIKEHNDSRAQNRIPGGTQLLRWVKVHGQRKQRE